MPFPMVIVSYTAFYPIKNGKNGKNGFITKNPDEVTYKEAKTQK